VSAGFFFPSPPLFVSRRLFCALSFFVAVVRGDEDPPLTRFPASAPLPEFAPWLAIPCANNRPASSSSTQVFWLGVVSQPPSYFLSLADPLRRVPVTDNSMACEPFSLFVCCFAVPLVPVAQPARDRGERRSRLDRGLLSSDSSCFCGYRDRTSPTSRFAVFLPPSILLRRRFSRALRLVESGVNDRGFF